MKKVLSLLLVVSMLLSVVTVASAAKFSDVDSNYSWAQDAIDTLSEQKVITGYEDGTFKPAKSITRQEAIALFSRALGASAETNETIINFAYGIYEVDLEECADSYAVKQGAYLVYRKVLTIDEVIDYLSPNKRNTELKRYEAATLIAKALGADAWLKNNEDVDTKLSYADVNSIPAKYVDYVFYTTTLGIMGDMGNNKFGPNENVTRAQIAVMIKRIADMMEFEYVGGVVATVDTLKNNLTVKTADGETVKFAVSNSDAVYIDANRVSLTDIEAGMEIAIILSKGVLYQIDAISYTEDESFSGAYKGQITDNSGTTVKIADMTKAGAPVSNFKLASNAVIFVNGQTAENLKSVSNGDYVTVQLSGGLVVRFTSQAKEETLTGLKITNVDGASADGVVLTVADKNGIETDYIVKDDVYVIKNSTPSAMTDLVVGDSVILTLEYGVIKNIKATGLTKTLEGTIEEITISNATSYITISKDGSKTKYIMSRNCDVTLEGEKVTVYDLRLGAYVKLKTESDTVISISSEAVESALQVTGKIKTINVAYNLLVLEIESATGTTEKQLFLKDTAKIIDSVTGKTLTIKGLKVGNIITAAGTEKLGVYEVNTLMILQ